MCRSHIKDTINQPWVCPSGSPSGVILESIFASKKRSEVPNLMSLLWCVGINWEQLGVFQELEPVCLHLPTRGMRASITVCVMSWCILARRWRLLPGPAPLSNPRMGGTILLRQNRSQPRLLLRLTDHCHYLAPDLLKLFGFSLCLLKKCLDHLRKII